MESTHNTDLPLTLQFHKGIHEISAEQWNALFNHEDPFLKHAFLLALEKSGSVCQETGWIPQHISMETEDGTLIAAMPLYIKMHSYGEYVFDWSWAEAYERHQIPYYPKLITAIPFTPAYGHRLGLHSTLDETTASQITNSIVKAVLALAKQHGFSSWHILFPNDRLNQQLSDAGLATRLGCQFHWYNRDYQSFEHYLEHFTSRRRKSVKKERRAISEQDISIRWLSGEDLSQEQLTQFYTFYQATYQKRGQQGYLTQTFFEEILQTIPEHLLFAMAYDKTDLAIGVALYFKSSDTLYGRYWGCLEEYKHLHFETCYYQGIEYCIQHKLQRFDPGAQGEHKIPRGFEPSETWSSHWIAHPGFKGAIGEFLEQEEQAVRDYMLDAAKLLPFKQG